MLFRESSELRSCIIYILLSDSVNSYQSVCIWFDVTPGRKCNVFTSFKIMIHGFSRIKFGAKDSEVSPM
jgi:hypothetical protein